MLSRETRMVFAPSCWAGLNVWWPVLWAVWEQSLCLQMDGISEFRRIENYQERSVRVRLGKFLFEKAQINFE